MTEMNGEADIEQEIEENSQVLGDKAQFEELLAHLKAINAENTTSQANILRKIHEFLDPVVNEVVELFQYAEEGEETPSIFEIEQSDFTLLVETCLSVLKASHCVDEEIRTHTIKLLELLYGGYLTAYTKGDNREAITAYTKGDQQCTLPLIPIFAECAPSCIALALSLKSYTPEEVDQKLAGGEKSQHRKLVKLFFHTMWMSNYGMMEDHAMKILESKESDLLLKASAIQPLGLSSLLVLQRVIQEHDDGSNSSIFLRRTAIKKIKKLLELIHNHSKAVTSTLAIAICGELRKPCDERFRRHCYEVIKYAFYRTPDMDSSIVDTVLETLLENFSKPPLSNAKLNFFYREEWFLFDAAMGALCLVLKSNTDFTSHHAALVDKILEQVHQTCSASNEFRSFMEVLEIIKSSKLIAILPVLADKYKR